MRKWFPVIPIGGAFLFSAYLYARLPERIVTHWSASGVPNGYSSRFVGAFMIPLISIAMWGFMRILPTIDPRRANYAKFQGTYDLFVNVVVTFLALVHVMVLGRAVGWSVPDPTRSVPFSVGLLVLILGNILPRARPNWWFGIRTPWTLSSDTVWMRTHRIGGYLLSAAGVVVMASTFLPGASRMPVAMIAICGASLGAVVYSYFAWRQEQS